MKPFFSYYGSKSIVSSYLGKPRRDLVIEPFAGSACYSLKWNCTSVRLYDVSPDICDLWDFLIRSSARDIQMIPDDFSHIDQIMSLPRGPQLLVRYWIARARAYPALSLSPWYLKHRNDQAARVWGRMAKRRIIDQKSMISKWSIDQISWDKIDITGEAHWHVDPPYSGAPGRKYPFDKVDFQRLADWCRRLPGAVDVCENLGADWLPFEALCEVATCAKGLSQEAVWRKL